MNFTAPYFTVFFCFRKVKKEPLHKTKVINLRKFTFVKLLRIESLYFGPESSEALYCTMSRQSIRLTVSLEDFNSLLVMVRIVNLSDKSIVDCQIM